MVDDNGIATNVWIGGNDSATEGTFKWTTGPEVGKTFYTGCETSTTARTGTTSTFAKWADGEPNNAIANDPYTPCTSTSTDFEGCIATNWRPSWAPRNALGLWNDLSCTSVNGQVKGYLVEYGDLELGGKFSGVFFSNFTLRPAPPVPAKPSFLKALFSIFRYKAAPVKKNVRTATYGLTLTSAGTYRFELLDKAGNLIKFLPGTVLAGWTADSSRYAITKRVKEKQVNTLLKASLRLSNADWPKAKYLVVTRLDRSTSGKITQVRQSLLVKNIRIR